MVGTGNLVYEMGAKVRAIAAGGIGLVEQLVDAIGLRARLDERVHVFTRHRPYHESDHILTMVYVLTGGQTLEDIERLRNDVTFLDAVGARRLPDPTTAGDFLRRFTPEDVTALMEAQNDARLRVWKAQPSRFRAQAVIDIDGTIVPTTGKKKEGADFAYNGTYGYGPLVISLEYQRVLYTVNRAAVSANRRSHPTAHAAGLGGVETSGFRVQPEVAVFRPSSVRRGEASAPPVGTAAGHWAPASDRAEVWGGGPTVVNGAHVRARERAARGIGPPRATEPGCGAEPHLILVGGEAVEVAEASGRDQVVLAAPA